MPLIKGTASVEDSRALTKALKSTKFPSNFDKSVAIDSVNQAVLTQWIEQRITKALSFEDEIVASTAVNLFLCDQPDPRQAQVALSGFLGEDGAAVVAAEIWDMVLEAAESPMGIPRKLLEEKKKELSEQRKLERQLPPAVQQSATRPVSPPPDAPTTDFPPSYQGDSKFRRGIHDENPARRDDFRRQDSRREGHTRDHRDRPMDDGRWRNEYRGDERDGNGRERREHYHRRHESRREDDRRRRRERSRSRERQSRRRSRSSSCSRSPSR